MTASWGNHLQMLGIRSQTAVVVVEGGGGSFAYFIIFQHLFVQT